MWQHWQVSAPLPGFFSTHTLASQSVLSLSSHLSVDGLIVSGVAGGGVLGRARPVVAVVLVVVGGGVGHGGHPVAVGGGDLGLASEGDLDGLLLASGDDGHVGVVAVAPAVSAAAAAAEAVDALRVDALVLKRTNWRLPT